MSQSKSNKQMAAALFTTGPYMDMTISLGTPMTPKIVDNVVTWKVPLGHGAVSHVCLQDCGYYVRWLFDHREEANGMDLEVAIDLIHYNDMANAFTAVTGAKAQYLDIDLVTYWKTGPMAPNAHRLSGYTADTKDPAAMTM